MPQTPKEIAMLAGLVVLLLIAFMVGGMVLRKGRA